MSATTRCRICGSEALADIISLGNQPLSGIFPAPGEEVPRSPLDLVCCTGDCGLVQLRHTADLDLMYGPSYGYLSSLNKAMAGHLSDIAKEAVSAISKDPAAILDIGSNDATLLKAYEGTKAYRLGVDPIGERLMPFYENIDFLGSRFSKSLIDCAAIPIETRRFDIITSIAMFYDLLEPMKFMQDVHDLLDDDGVWITEQSYLPTMMANRAYDSICHEHLEYYGLRPILWMADRCGFVITKAVLNDVNGGSIRLHLRKAKKDLLTAGEVWRLLREESELDYAAFAKRVIAHRGEVREFFDAKRGNRILGLGASTKGNVLLSYCGVTKQDLPAIADINESKHGKLTPGTGIPIVSEITAGSMKPEMFFVLPWHFRDNILTRYVTFRASGGKFVFPLPNIEVV